MSKQRHKWHQVFQVVNYTSFQPVWTCLPFLTLCPCPDDAALFCHVISAFAFFNRLLHCLVHQLTYSCLTGIKHRTWHLRVVAALVLLMVTGYWLVSCGVKLRPSSLCGRSSIDLLICPRCCQWAAMIFLHCWPHKLSDALPIEVREVRGNSRTRPLTGSRSDKLSKPAVNKLSVTYRLIHTSPSGTGDWCAPVPETQWQDATGILSAQEHS